MLAIVNYKRSKRLHSRIVAMHNTINVLEKRNQKLENALLDMTKKNQN